MKWIIITILIFVIISGVAAFKFISNTKTNTTEVASTEKQMIIGFLMASNSSSIERWIKDRDFFVAKAEELGAKVVVLDAGTDAELQQKQAEDLILRGVDVLVIVPQDAVLSALIVDKAHEAGIKVIAYDRLIKNPALDYYISFDNVKVGESEAEGVLKVQNTGKFAYVGGSPTDTNAFLVKEGAFNILQPRIDNKDIELVFNEFTADWKEDISYINMKKFLDDGGTVDAVVAANDSTARGVIRAFEEKGLAGKIPVSGQDATLSGIQFIVEGKQTVTVYKPIKDLAYKSAEIAVAVMRGGSVVTNNVVENGTVFTPAFLLDVVSVTKDNIADTVIKDGYLTKEEIYGE